MSRRKGWFKPVPAPNAYVCSAEVWSPCSGYVRYLVRTSASGFVGDCSCSNVRHMDDVLKRASRRERTGA